MDGEEEERRAHVGYLFLGDLAGADLEPHGAADERDADRLDDGKLGQVAGPARINLLLLLLLFEVALLRVGKRQIWIHARTMATAEIGAHRCVIIAAIRRATATAERSKARRGEAEIK